MNSKADYQEVIISATCFADANATIEIATRLATSATGNIRAVLVEDEVVIQHAKLPMVHAITQGGRDSGAITAETMQQAYERDASDLRRVLEKATEHLSLMCSIERQTGGLNSTLHQSTKKGDLLLYGHQALGRYGQSGIYVITLAENPEPELIDLGKTISAQYQQPLKLILLTSNDQVGNITPDVPAINISINTKAANLKTHERDFRGLLDFLNLKRPANIVTSLRIAEEVSIETMLSASRCPIIVPIT